MSSSASTDGTITEDQLRDRLRSAGGQPHPALLVGLADDALGRARRGRIRRRTALAAAMALAAAAAGLVVTALPASRQSPAGTTQATAVVTLAAPIRFVPVLRTSPGACTSSSGYTSLPQGGEIFCYQLDESKGLTVSGLSALGTELSPRSGAWTVDLTLLASDRDRFATLTKAEAAQVYPELAVVVDHTVLFAPDISSPITGGRMQISGGFDHQGALDLVHRLSGR